MEWLGDGVFSMRRERNHPDRRAKNLLIHAREGGSCGARHDASCNTSWNRRFPMPDNMPDMHPEISMRGRHPRTREKPAQPKLAWLKANQREDLT